MVIWTQSMSIVISREDKQIKANTVAAAAVLWSPDKTAKKKKHPARFVFPAFLCLPLICVYLVMTLPVFSPCTHVYS